MGRTFYFDDEQIVLTFRDWHLGEVGYDIASLKAKFGEDCEKFLERVATALLEDYWRELATQCEIEQIKPLPEEGK